MNRGHIYTLMISAAVCSACAIAKDQNMSGVQIGAGITVAFDKNEFNADVANQVKSVKTEAAANATGDISKVVNGLWGYNELGTSNATKDIDVGEHNNVISTSKSITVAPYDDGTNITYYTATKQSKINKVGIGAEVKLAYFHDFNNGIMIGIDTACAFSPKKKKIARQGEMDAHPDLNVKIDTDGPQTFSWNGKEYTGGNATITKDKGLSIFQKYQVLRLQLLRLAQMKHYTATLHLMKSMINMLKLQ